MQEMQQQHGQVEQERRLLESELEAVRNRAVEMAEMLDEQKRQATQQQGQWTDELKRMRRLLEDMSVRTVRDEPVVPVEQQPVPRQPAPRRAADPALDSVMAQFEMLQKDLARRRANGTKR